MEGHTAAEKTHVQTRGRERRKGRDSGVRKKENDLDNGVKYWWHFGEKINDLGERKRDRDCETRGRE